MKTSDLCLAWISINSRLACYKFIGPLVVKVKANNMSDIGNPTIKIELSSVASYVERKVLRYSSSFFFFIIQIIPV